MARHPYPSETSDRFIVRFPDGMRDRLKEAAVANNRSMNAEIVARLERSLSGPTGMDKDSLEEMVTELLALTKVQTEILERLTPTDWDEFNKFMDREPSPSHKDDPHK